MEGRTKLRVLSAQHIITVLTTWSLQQHLAPRDISALVVQIKYLAERSMCTVPSDQRHRLRYTADTTLLRKQRLWTYAPMKPLATLDISAKVVSSPVNVLWDATARQVKRAVQLVRFAKQENMKPLHVQHSRTPVAINVHQERSRVREMRDSVPSASPESTAPKTVSNANYAPPESSATKPKPPPAKLA